ncbi:MAG: hypothetical protein R3B57_07875 [Phycisphaerales bacterium]
MMRNARNILTLAAALVAGGITGGSAPLQNAQVLQGAGFVLELTPARAAQELSAEGFTLTGVVNAARPTIPDLAAPFGVIDAADTAAFVRMMDVGDPNADLAEPWGVIDAGDFVEFTRRHEAARK